MIHVLTGKRCRQQHIKTDSHLLCLWDAPKSKRYLLLPTANCQLPTAYCLLPTAYCLLPTAYCLLPTAYCLLPTAYCLLPTAYCYC
eukprot:scaffold1875_cov124-Skeletonema_menzelii.AAC.2